MGVALAACSIVSEGCVLSRREVMLSVTTDIADCTIFDRVEVRVSRGTEPSSTFDQTFMRADCPVVGVSPPSTVPLAAPSTSAPTGGEFRLGIVDDRRTDDRVRIEVSARTATGVVFTTAAETDFVDGKVYAVPVQLALSCYQASALACPSAFVCRPRPDTGVAACGSVYRLPGTLGTFP